ncbi:hypothetical protein MLD38_001564 [Melastoma candidum]|uniref:Uncharacterized protein n=1 Tax=Melastoma candidum TaxID=119954 RepID=A0ACB9SIJ8_9MYRT|nr:hypothetical protein MLD38_001564 [Melastoma candidum]
MLCPSPCMSSAADADVPAFDSAGLFAVATSQPPQLLPPLSPIPSSLPVSKLIPGTRFLVDAFRHSGNFSRSYFLSHFHSDHYTGINSSWSGGVIFCSHITARLLVEVLNVRSSFAVALPVGETVVVDGCQVRLIDANHCPGAVVMLFRVVDVGRVFRYVHTGDFRYCDAMSKDEGLREFVGSDAVFLDTTYCNPKFVFPSQQESIDYVVGVIEKGGVGKVLFLVAAYVIGKERILLEVSRRCGRKVCVDARKMAVLRALGYEEGDAFTEDKSRTDVHVIGWNVLGETWPYFRPNFVKLREIQEEKGYEKVVGFVPTGWTYEVKRKKFSVRTKDSLEIHLVPYSEHSNYDELREFVKFLRPKRVIPTVGSDIEKLDSKHVERVRKHFAGLVDETANKKDFLTNFHNISSRNDAMHAEDDSIAATLNESTEVVGEAILSNNDDDAKLNLGSTFGGSSDKKVVNPLDVDMIPFQGEEEQLEALHDCLPAWVTRDQMLELINSSGGNVVEAVNNFYEHETDFHQQVGPSISSSAATASLNYVGGASSLSTQDTMKVSAFGNVEQSPTKDYISFQKMLSGKNMKTQTKKTRNSGNSPRKKLKSSAKSEAVRAGQSKITRFFNKPFAESSQPAVLSSNDEACSIKEKISGSSTKAVDQFIQIVSGDASLRSYASSILDKTNGDISLALEMYYDQLSDRVLSGRNAGPPEKNDEACNIMVDRPSFENEGKFVSLPLEKYDPAEHAFWSPGEPAPYLHLARTFELIEKERGRIKATSMICNMFRSLLALSPEDVLPAIYLCTNKIAADHENVELNIGGGLVSAALGEACGVKQSTLRDMYNKLGDLGDVAQECRQTQSLLSRPSPLLIRDVFFILHKISSQTGSGSTHRKKSLIMSLMRSCREMEMKFIVRTLVRNLRIGAMMRTILPAFAQAVAWNSSSYGYQEDSAGRLEKFQRLSNSVIEAYNILPSLDFVIPALMKEGLGFSISSLSMTPSVPIKPMLAKIVDGIPSVLEFFHKKAFTCEYKYDGQRAQIHKLTDGSIRIFSRNGDDTTSRFPDLICIVEESCKPSALTFIVDAEVVAVDRENCKLMSFQELSSRKRGGRDSLVSIDKIQVDICLFVFDIMFANGEKLLSHPLRKRREILKETFSDEKGGYFEYAKEMTVEAEESQSDKEGALTRVNSFLNDAISASCEGLMVKTLDVDAGYFPSKRADSWLKVKRDYVAGLSDSLDLVPIGAWHGNGRKAGWYSPFLMACYDPDLEEYQSVCRVLSGFSDTFYIEMKEYFSGDRILSKMPPYYKTGERPDMWFSPEVVWEIKAADFTVSPVHHAAIGLVHPSRGISMRFPRFVRVRSDKDPEDCSTSTDVADLFRVQSRKMNVVV